MKSLSPPGSALQPLWVTALPSTPRASSWLLPPPQAPSMLLPAHSQRGRPQAPTWNLLAVEIRFRFTVARTLSLCRVLAMARVLPVRGRSRLVVGTTSAKSRETSSSLTGPVSWKKTPWADAHSAVPWPWQGDSGMEGRGHRCGTWALRCPPTPTGSHSCQTARCHLPGPRCPPPWEGSGLPESRQHVTSGRSGPGGSTFRTEPLIHWHLLERGVQALHVVPGG